MNERRKSPITNFLPPLEANEAKAANNVNVPNIANVSKPAQLKNETMQLPVALSERFEDYWFHRRKEDPTLLKKDLFTEAIEQYLKGKEFPPMPPEARERLNQQKLKMGRKRG